MSPPAAPGRPVRLFLRCPWYSGNLGLGKMDILLYVSTLLPVTTAKPPPPGERGAVGPALRGGRLLPGRHSRFLLPAPERSLAAEAWARLSHSKAVSVFVVFVIVLQAAVGAFCSTLKKKKKKESKECWKPRPVLLPLLAGFKILQPKHQSILPVPSPDAPASGLIALVCPGPSRRKSYAIVSPPHSSRCGGPPFTK